jgi:hypothetical protein
MDDKKKQNQNQDAQNQSDQSYGQTEDIGQAGGEATQNQDTQEQEMDDMSNAE